MNVFVRSKSGQWLMPTKPAKARVLLKQGKAKVIRNTPFSIQLLYDTADYVQLVTVGIDDGGVTVGIAAVSGGRVLYQEELALRTDIKSKMDTRRQYRRTRRYRKTRYRKARFMNRKQSIPVCKVCGGNAPKSHVICRLCLVKANGVHQKYRDVRKTQFRLPVSIRAKKDAIVRVVKGIPLPVARIKLEDAYFDFQVMDNPDISGLEYQHGALLYHKNYKSACLTRDGYKCMVCKAEHDLRCHHVKPKSEGGTDRLPNLMTLCEFCHDKHHRDGLKLPKQKSYFYIAAAHVQQGKNYLQIELAGIAPLETTFGYITSYCRNMAGIDKSHVNDAVIIADRNAHPVTWYIKSRHVQSRKRSLHEATARKGRTEPNHDQKRNNKNVFKVKGFRKWDSVRLDGISCFISGFTGGNGCYLVNAEGKYIQIPGKNYKQVPLTKIALVHHNQGIISQRVQV